MIRAPRDRWQGVKVFLGLYEVAGYYTRLREGFAELGIECCQVDLTDHPFKYDEEKPQRLAKWLRAAFRRREATPRRQVFSKILWIALQTALLIYTILKYDVFVFAANSQFWRFLHLPIIRWLGKKIVYVSHGTDARPLYMSHKGVGMSPCDIVRRTRDQKEVSRGIERYADAIVDLRTVSQFREGPLIDFLRVGLPQGKSVQSLEDSPPRIRAGIRVLHSPSLPKAKGTALIRDAIQRLEAKGYEIEFVEVIGQPHAVVRQELKKCDFVVDQLYSDTPMAGFAAEAAAFGKPAIVGGYAGALTRDTVASGSLPPSHYCLPEEVESAIERLIVDATYRVELGRRAKDFVDSNWTSRNVAERYVRIARGDVPADWLYDPRKVCYVYGAGISKDQARALIRSVIEIGGKESLQVSDKPLLEKQLVEFAFRDAAMEDGLDAGNSVDRAAV